MSATLHSWPVRISVVAAVAVGAGALTLLPGGSPPAAAAGLVPWSGCDTLLEHYRDELERTATPFGVGQQGGFVRGDVMAVGAGSVPMPMPAGARSEAATAESADSAGGGALDAVGSGPTGTNVQERGVDEPDTVKAVDGLLFVSTQGRLTILRSGSQPELLSSVPLGEDGASAELLVDGDRVLALVSGWEPVDLPAPSEPAPPPVEPAPEPAPLPEPIPLVPPDATSSSAISVPAPGRGVVTAVLVDVADPSAPEVLESLELDGRYVSARLVDGTVRLVTSSTPVVPAVMPAEPYGGTQEKAALEANTAAARNASLEQVLPQAVRRDAEGVATSSGPAVGCGAVHHASTGPQGTGTLVVSTLRPEQGLEVLDSTAVTTDGDLVYASPERLYVATSRWGTVSPAGMTVPDGEVTTELHAFDTTAADRTPYLGSGSVRGYVYGRWALSSHEGHLRVATTLQPPWNGGGRSSSSLAVLAERDGGLTEVGRVDGLGPDEQIYAVRYFGDLATVVTFRQTDPLYVLDLADPTAPEVLGELKIPGFSTYLHPVGDDRLLGVGQDADDTGRVTGFQLSLFDLSDLSSPVQVDRLSLGQGWSPASEDSRAFAYDPSRQQAALPFSDDRGRAAALGVRIDGDRLVESGRLSVGGDHVERTLLVDGTVLAVTPGSVVAGDVETWARTGAASLGG